METADVRVSVTERPRYRRTRCRIRVGSWTLDLTRTVRAPATASSCDVWMSTRLNRSGFGGGARGGARSLRTARVGGQRHDEKRPTNGRCLRGPYPSYIDCFTIRRRTSRHRHWTTGSELSWLSRNITRLRGPHWQPGPRNVQTRARPQRPRPVCGLRSTGGSPPKIIKTQRRRADGNCSTPRR